MIAIRSYARFAATNKSMIASLLWVSYFLVHSLRSALHVSRWSAAIAADTTCQLSALAVLVGFSFGVGSRWVNTQTLKALGVPEAVLAFEHLRWLRRTRLRYAVMIFLTQVAFLSGVLSNLFAPHFGSTQVFSLVGAFFFLCVSVQSVMMFSKLTSATHRLESLNGYESPCSARWLADLLLPYKRAEVLIGDLEERFPRKCREVGVVRARCWYWRQVVYSLLPIVWATWEIIRRIGR